MGGLNRCIVNFHFCHYTSANLSPARSIPVLSMPQDLSSPPSNRTGNSTSASRREYAWQVASNLLISFRYAWAGLSYAFQTQRNFRIHSILTFVVIGLGLFLQLPAVEMAILGLTIGAVLATELLNTALESVVDLTVKQTYHELAKIAKDCAAGAVLVSALTAIFSGGILLLPPLFERLQNLL